MRVEQKASSLSSWNRKRLLKKIAFFFALAVFISLAGTGAWFLRNGEFMKIVEVKVSGTRMVSPDAVLDLVKGDDAKHGGFLGFVLPEDHRLAFKDDGELVGLIKSRFPRVKDVSIFRDYEGRSISISVSERREGIIWCSAPASPGSQQGESAEPQQGGPDAGNPPDGTKNCFWLDGEGFVIGEAPDAIGTLVPVVTDRSGKEIFLGKVALPAEKLANLVKAEKMVSGFGWTAEETVIGDYLFKEAAITISSGQKLLISLERGPEEEGIPVLNAIVSSGSWPKTEYVDLRIEGKGFYKLK